MDTTILLILVQDGVVNGAIYALLALSLVLVFAVTRVVFIPQGELVAYGALTYAALDAGTLPGSVWLLCALGAGAFAAEAWRMRRRWRTRALLRLAAGTLLLPAVVAGLAMLLAPRRPGVAVEALLALAIVTPMAPYLYRIAFQPMAEASVLTLLIAAVGVHFVLLGLGLVFFGPEGSRASGFSDAVFSLGALTVQGQAVWIAGLTVALMLALSGFFEFTLFGRALRATAVNRLGARLVGIATGQSGAIAFTLAGAIGALSGVLIAPLATIYYDSGFLIGLKGFTAAIIAGLASYPGAVLAAVLVGLVESFSAFWASAFKEVIVFTIIIPVLLWRSWRHGPTEDEE
ncbi:MAG: branched-chain amino acid ABC transporter permease [Rhodospirillales bacterium 70-18]|nr:branched-chain amino acid ABC transporter permease [Rhodospirillales bacterium]OJY70521.1 MAG: branched-chain amino acid ABC transporter permease [Rhodospirillales bacterium 70-18]